MSLYLDLFKETEKIQVIYTRSERGDFTIDPTDVDRIISG